MENGHKKIIFFLHLNDITVEKGAIPVYYNSIKKESKYPDLICKIRNKLYKTVYIMYLIDFQISNKNSDEYFFLQVNKNMKYIFEININEEYYGTKNKNKFYFYFDKILFKERIKGNFFEKIFNKSKDTGPPFSCDINIFEQTQLILGYINSQKRKEQFELLQSLKKQLGLTKFSRLTELFLMYLKIIFVDNYNTELIQDLISNYKFINFDVKPSFNHSLFFDSFIKPIFLKPYKERNFFIYNNFEYDLRNCLNTEYNKIFDKLCIKYYIHYDKDFLLNENNFNSRIITNIQKNQFYELLYEVFYELNLFQYCDFLQKNKNLSKDYIEEIFINKKKIINDIKNHGKNIFNINNFNGLKIYELDNYNIPYCCLGKLNNNFWIRSVDDKELNIFDEALDAKMIINYNFSKNTTSVFQMRDGNIIIVYSNMSKVSIIEIKNFFEEINLIYTFSDFQYNNYYENDEDMNSNDYIIKSIEISNKNIVILTKLRTIFYYNQSLHNIKTNENMPLYDYYKYAEIKEKNNIINLSILEFNNNFIIILSGMDNNSIIIKKCYLTFVNIIQNKNNKNVYNIKYYENIIKGFEILKSSIEDNNILIKLSDDILAIGSNNIYLYSLKYKEIFQMVEMPSLANFNLKCLCSFYLSVNQIIYIAVKYFDIDENNNNIDLSNFEIKFYIYCFLEKYPLSEEKELIFLSEAIPESQEPFFKAIEIQN